MKDIFVGIVAPESMAVVPDNMVKLAKEALQEAGFEVGDVELWEVCVQHGELHATASMDISGGVFTGRRSFSYEKGGVTVEAELP